MKGLGGPSRDELVSQASGIPVMGGVTGGKKIIASGIPVMGGVTGIKKSGNPVMGGVATTGTKKTIVEKDVERKIAGRAAGNPTIGAGGRALREAPRAQIEGNVCRASGNPTTCIEGRALREAPHVL